MTKKNKETPREQFVEACLRLVPKPEKNSEYKNPPLDSQNFLRWKFLETSFRLVPEMRETLEKDLVPIRPNSSNFLDPDKEYITACTDWAEKFNIKNDWVLNSINNSVLNWDTSDTNSNQFIISGFMFSPSSWEANDFEFKNPGWKPWLHSLPGKSGLGFEAFCNVLSEHLCNYFEQQMQRAEKLGITFLPDRRERAYSPAHRMEWLVRRVVQRWTRKRIVEEYGIGSSKNPENAIGYVGKVTNELARILPIKIPSPLLTMP